ncbi:hypothetical protein [Lysinibacillus sp. FSL K6-0102]|uniref:hypothetical protein n=1 Tax=Lysinibacillus sp. FSL K6-0102 TaxID=2975290 RepID=UPI0030F76716
MQELGNRVIFDTVTGRIVHQFGEAKGVVVPHEDINGLDYVDLPYGIVGANEFLVSINPDTKEPIIEAYPEPELTDEQKRIRELEDTLLLQTDNEIGGIL